MTTPPPRAGTGSRPTPSTTSLPEPAARPSGHRHERPPPGADDSRAGEGDLPPLRLEDLARDGAGSGGHPRLQLLIVGGTFVVSVLVNVAAAPWIQAHLHFPFVERLGFLSLPFLVLAMVMATAAGVVAHEAGHALAGRAAGFRCKSFVVGPLEIHRTTGGFELRRARGLPFLAGTYHGYPIRREWLRWRYAFLVAGGPIASLTLGTAALYAYVTLGGGTAAAYGYGPPALGGLWTLGLFGAASMAMSGVNLLPFSWSGFATDGQQLIRTCWDERQARRFEALLSVYAASHAGVRPRDWDPNLLEACRGPGEKQGVMAGEGHFLAYRHELDRGKLRSARDSLERALRAGDVPSAVFQRWTLEAAFVEGAIRGDAQGASRWLQRTEPSSVVPPGTRARAEYGLHLASGDEERARETLAEAREALRTDLDRGRAAAEREWLAGVPGQ